MKLAKKLIIKFCWKRLQVGYLGSEVRVYGENLTDTGSNLVAKCDSTGWSSSVVDNFKCEKFSCSFDQKVITKARPFSVWILLFLSIKRSNFSGKVVFECFFLFFLKLAFNFYLAWQTNWFISRQNEISEKENRIQSYKSISFLKRLQFNFKYRRPSLFAGVTSQEYPVNTKTANNKGTLLWALNSLLAIKKVPNPRITEGNVRG